MMATARLRRTAHLSGNQALRKMDCGVLNPDALISGVVDAVVGDAVGLPGVDGAGWVEVAATDKGGRLAS